MPNEEKEKSKTIIFVTGNKGKVSSAQQHFKNIKLEIYSADLLEPRSDDIKEIAASKVRQAYELVKNPCIALDAGFFVNSLNGFPRAFVNFALGTLGIEGILKCMEGVKDRSCYFEECLAYYDGDKIEYFVCKHPGKLTTDIRGNDKEEAWSKLWHIFVPENAIDGRTLAELSTKEVEEYRERTNSSMQDFAEWYEGL